MSLCLAAGECVGAQPYGFCDGNFHLYHVGYGASEFHETSYAMQTAADVYDRRIVCVGIAKSDTHHRE